MAAGGNRTSENRSAYDPNTDAVKSLVVGPDGTTAVSYADAFGYPVGGTPLQNGSGNKTNAAAVATLASAPGKVACLAQVIITAKGATAAGVVNLTITGLLGGPLVISFPVPAGVDVRASDRFPFNPPLVAATAATDIVVTLDALGAGNVCAGVAAHGYRA